MGNANDATINVAYALNEYFNNYHIINFIKYDLKNAFSDIIKARKKLYNMCNQDMISN